MPKSLTFESKYANRHVCNPAVGAQSGRHNRCPAVPEMVWRTHWVLVTRQSSAIGRETRH